MNTFKSNSGESMMTMPISSALYKICLVGNEPGFGDIFNFLMVVQIIFALEFREPGLILLFS